MDRVVLKVKRLDNNPDLPLPSYQSGGSSGLDLRAAVVKEVTLRPGEIMLIPTGYPFLFPKVTRHRSGPGADWP